MTKTGNIRTAAVVAIRAPAVHGVSSYGTRVLHCGSRILENDSVFFVVPGVLWYQGFLWYNGFTLLF